MAKIHEWTFELLSHSPYYLALPPSDCFLFSDLKRMLGLNEEVIAKTEVYFQAKKKSYYKNGITILEGRNSQCITLERNYVRKKIIIISLISVSIEQRKKIWCMYRSSLHIIPLLTMLVIHFLVFLLTPSEHLSATLPCLPLHCLSRCVLCFFFYFSSAILLPARALAACRLQCGQAAEIEIVNINLESAANS